MEVMPAFWDFMMASLFQVQSPRLRQQLWERYPKSTALRWQLARCEEPTASELAKYERVKRLCGHLDPATLLRVADGLAPLGRARPQEIRDFEEVVLGLMDKHGQFKWLPEEGTYDQRRVAGTQAHRPA